MLWNGWKSLLRKAGKAHLTEEGHILHKQEDPAYTTVLSAMEMNHLDGWGPAVWDSDVQNTKGCTPKWLWTFLYFFYGQQEYLHLCFSMLHWEEMETVWEILKFISPTNYDACLFVLFCYEYERVEANEHKKNKLLRTHILWNYEKEWNIQKMTYWMTTISK